MKLSTLTLVELILFNLAFILVYQPRFIFKILPIKDTGEEVLSKALTWAGIVTMCVLFVWSFYFGAMLFVYKRSMLY